VRKGLAAALQLDRAPVELWLDLPERTVFFGRLSANLRLSSPRLS
jgi:hypothetical protein